MTQRQQEILDWLRSNAPSLAPAFDGAVRLLAEPDIPARVNFISHAVRDISDRLVYCLDDNLKTERVQYENLLDRFHRLCPSLGDLFNADGQNRPRQSIEIPSEAAAVLGQLINDHNKRLARRSRYELLFARLSSLDPAHPQTIARLAQQFEDARTWFMSRTHLTRQMSEPVDEVELRLYFEVFEVLLHGFVGHFFTRTLELDAILQQANG